MDAKIMAYFVAPFMAVNYALLMHEGRMHEGRKRTRLRDVVQDVLASWIGGQLDTLYEVSGVGYHGLIAATGIEARVERFMHKHFPVDLTKPSSKYKRRVIYDREGIDPYLARFYLNSPPTMPDGSEPFEVDGSPREGIQWREGWGVHPHFFFRGDSDEALHCHPWEWAFSLILTGGYSEERRIGDKVVRRWFRPFTINFLRKDSFHRVDLLDPKRGAWTLFVTGPKVATWGFWDRKTGVYMPWREFIAHKRGEVRE